MIRVIETPGMCEGGLIRQRTLFSGVLHKPQANMRQTVLLLQLSRRVAVHWCLLQEQKEPPDKPEGLTRPATPPPPPKFAERGP